MKRIIALILTLTFLSQDISWAYPDTPVIARPRSGRSNLAPQSLFINPTDDFHAASLYREIAETSEKSGIPLNRLDLGTVRAILTKHEGEPWLKFTEPRTGEILVTFDGGNMLRFYDPQAKIGTVPFGDSPYFSNKIINELQMPPGSRFGIQYLKVEALPPPSSVAQEPNVVVADYGLSYELPKIGLLEKIRLFTTPVAIVRNSPRLLREQTNRKWWLLLVLGSVATCASICNNPDTRWLTNVAVAFPTVVFCIYFWIILKQYFPFRLDRTFIADISVKIGTLNMKDLDVVAHWAHRSNRELLELDHSLHRLDWDVALKIRARSKAVLEWIEHQKFSDSFVRDYLIMTSKKFFYDTWLLKSDRTLLLRYDAYYQKMIWFFDEIEYFGKLSRRFHGKGFGIEATVDPVINEHDEHGDGSGGNLTPVPESNLTPVPARSLDDAGAIYSIKSLLLIAAGVAGLWYYPAVTLALFGGIATVGIVSLVLARSGLFGMFGMIWNKCYGFFSVIKNDDEAIEYAFSAKEVKADSQTRGESYYSRKADMANFNSNRVVENRNDIAVPDNRGGLLAFLVVYAKRLGFLSGKYGKESAGIDIGVNLNPLNFNWYYRAGDAFMNFIRECYAAF
ncbi:MAG: hypothetical protein Q7S07_04670, partial [Candidatus Omnitrophota bacterium]|nr:hypothetical protein [Candidatus Omnitrophota bacterium]